MNIFQRAYRATMDQIAKFTNSTGGYNAGKVNRLTANFSRNLLPENRVPAGQIEQCRAESWSLYRNNPYARKIVRTLETKVIGRGMHPQSQATYPDGTPHVEFRRAARKLWWSLHNCCDVRGKPGRGGLDIVELQKLALRQVILSGETLARPKVLTRRQQSQLGCPVRLAMHLISAERLSPYDKAAGFVDGNDWYRGIELDSDGRRVAYHLITQRLDEFNYGNLDVFRVPAEDIFHVYAQEDIDQLRGTPWFSAAIFQARDTGDYQYNVLKASAIAACFVAGYSLPSGKSRLGLAEQQSGDLTDSDGNPITRLQPGMLLNLGKDGKLEAINPGQPTTNAEAFIQHMLRGTAAAMPGVKSSTITGDYRNSSFSSERSADNDCWPEMEGVQDWFATSFMQPWYEQVITTAVAEGLLPVTQEEFLDRRADYLDTNWSGPVPRSINPTDDAKSSAMRIANGQSSPQIECAAIGRDPQDVIAEVQEWVAMCEAAGLPDWYIATSLGQTKQPFDQQTQGVADGQNTPAA